MHALLAEGDPASLREYFRLYADFHINHCYDTYSFEGCITELVQQGAGLRGRGTCLIKTEEDFNTWSWDELPNRYFEKSGPMFDVMDNIISTTKIDANHSNEDAIAPMTRRLENYGERIGNLGGIDMDVLCRENEAELRFYVTERYKQLAQYRGTAIGSGDFRI